MKTHTLAKQEDLLSDYASRLKRHCRGRVALHVRLSGLLPFNRKGPQVGLAAALLRPLAQRHEGQLFRLSNADLVLVGKDMPQGELSDAVLRIRYMFRDDPHAEEAGLEADNAFCRIYTLEREYAAFTACVARLREACRQSEALDTSALSAAMREGTEPEGGEALTPHILGQLEHALEILDIETVLRRHYVYAVVDDAAPRPVFWKYYVSLPALARRLVPGYDVTADRWLLQRLQTRLDKRLMAVLPDIDIRSDVPLNIEMQVESIAAPGFHDFLGDMRQRGGKPLLVEMPAVGLLADMARFGFARNVLHTNSHKIAIGAIDPMLFSRLDLAALGADFYKLCWMPEYRDWLQTEFEAFAHAVESVGAPHVILAGCRDEESVETGLRAGIRLFEGPHLDHLALASRPAVATG